MEIPAIREVVQAALHRASQATGVDFSFLLKTAGRESGFNPHARSGQSSAAGLFQFVEQTWLSTLKQHGAKYGYARYADLISKASDGHYYVKGEEARRAVMDLRMDPHASALMAGELAADHAAYLRGRTGRAPTSGELYAAHFLGPEGSARLIEAVQTTPGAVAAHLFPEAAHANRSIFYHDGHAVSVAEVYANLTKAAGPSEPVTPDAPAADPAGGFIQYASARQADHLREEQELVAMILRGAEPPDDAGVGQRLTGSMFTSEMLRMLSDAQGQT